MIFKLNLWFVLLILSERQDFNGKSFSFSLFLVADDEDDGCSQGRSQGGTPSSKLKFVWKNFWTPPKNRKCMRKKIRTPLEKFLATPLVALHECLLLLTAFLVYWIFLRHQQIVWKFIMLAWKIATLSLWHLRWWTSCGRDCINIPNMLFT